MSTQNHPHALMLISPTPRDTSDQIISISKQDSIHLDEVQNQASQRFFESKKLRGPGFLHDSSLAFPASVHFLLPSIFLIGLIQATSNFFCVNLQNKSSVRPLLAVSTLYFSSSYPDSCDASLFFFYKVGFNRL